MVTAIVTIRQILIWALHSVNTNVHVYQDTLVKEMLDARRSSHLNQLGVLQTQNVDQAKLVETVNALIRAFRKIHVPHLLYVPSITTDQAVNAHLDSLVTQDPNVAKSREENVITMTSVLIIKHVLNINVLIHVSRQNLVAEKHYVKPRYIELFVAVHQTGVAILMSNASNTNV